MLKPLHYKLWSLTILLTLICYSNSFSQTKQVDSTKTTSFRKGRWVAGLAGSISSGSTKSSTTNEKAESNRYLIEVSLSNFVIDRLSIGFVTNLQRDNLQNKDVKTTEEFFIAPKATYYLSKSDIGSLFFRIAPGITLFRDEEKQEIDSITYNIENKGEGFGVQTTFGYSYVLHDLITFDLGLNWSHSWISITQESSPNIETTNFDLEISDLSFSFGFNILLDKHYRQ